MRLSSNGRGTGRLAAIGCLTVGAMVLMPLAPALAVGAQPGSATQSHTMAAIVASAEYSGSTANRTFGHPVVPTASVHAASDRTAFTSSTTTHRTTTHRTTTYRVSARAIQPAHSVIESKGARGKTAHAESAHAKSADAKSAHAKSPHGGAAQSPATSKSRTPSTAGGKVASTRHSGRIIVSSTSPSVGTKTVHKAVDKTAHPAATRAGSATSSGTYASSSAHSTRHTTGTARTTSGAHRTSAVAAGSTHRWSLATAEAVAATRGAETVAVSLARLTLALEVSRTGTDRLSLATEATRRIFVGLADLAERDAGVAPGSLTPPADPPTAAPTTPPTATPTSTSTPRVTAPAAPTVTPPASAPASPVAVAAAPRRASTTRVTIGADSQQSNAEQNGSNPVNDGNDPTNPSQTSPGHSATPAVPSPSSKAPAAPRRAVEPRNIAGAIRIGQVGLSAGTLPLLLLGLVAVLGMLLVIAGTRRGTHTRKP